MTLPDSRSSPSSLGCAGQSGLNVLLVDDDPDDLYLARSELLLASLSVSSADCLTDALSLLRAHQYDVVLLDLGLPDSFGLATLESVVNAARVPVVVLTSLDDPAVGLQAVAHGAQDFVTKGDPDRGPLARTLRYAVERHALQRALLAAEERYRSIVDTAQEGIGVVDLDLRVSFANRRLAEMLGYEVEDVLGRHVSDFLHPDEAERLLSSEPWHGHEEVRWRRRDGTDLWALQSNGALSQHDGETVGYFAMLTDISAHKQAEAAQRWLAGIVESSEEAIVGMATDGTILSWNPAAHRLYGFTAEETLGAPATMLVPAQRRAEFEGIFDRVRRGEQVPRWRSQRLRKDGVVVEVDVTKFPVEDDEGRVVGVSAIEHDITALVEAERAVAAVEQRVRESEERLRLTFDSGPVAMALVDLDGRFLQVNPALCRMLGREAAELLGVDIDSLTDPPGSVAGASIPATLATDGSFAGERRIRRAHGNHTWLRIHAAGVRDERDRPVHAIVHFEDVTDRKSAEQQLAAMALHDPLTGLPNRVLLMDRIEQDLRQIARYSPLLAVLFLDLDNFKDVNDVLGHEAGDQLLVQVARRLEQVVRAPDTVARIGGDEFVVLCHIKHTDHAVEIAQRVQAEIARPIALRGHEETVTAGVGIAIAGAAVTDPYDLLRAADTALYDAKRKGRNRHSLYAESLRLRAISRAEAERAVRHAIDHDGLRVEYQPIVEVPTGRIVAAEALVRIDHPTKGRLYPDSFLPVAEASGLIVPLGRAVLEESCRQIALWQDRLDPPRVTVNVSPRQLATGDITEMVDQALARTGADPRLLVLELTETTLLEAARSFIRVIDALRERGIQIYLDDFGTGYNSLSYLRIFPADAIKIPHPFTAGLGRDPDDTAIVRSVTQLGRDLRLDVVAEGIETVTQLDYLREFGCPLAQGFHFARPADPAAVTEMLTRGYLPSGPCAGPMAPAATSSGDGSA